MKRPAPSALILNDSAVLSLVMERFLGGLGFRTTIVTVLPGQSELAACDVVFMELLLRDENGFRLVRRLRRCCRCPVILISGSGRRTDLAWGLRAGASTVISRPLSFNRLHEALVSFNLVASTATVA
jgi:DNA-binding response OmpR family regulator